MKKLTSSYIIRATGDKRMEWLDKALDAYCKLLEWLLVLLLAAMVVMVFGNVVLRYGFNSGITFSEELSRWAFVWMTFLGAIIGLKESAHLGTDMLVSRLGSTGKKVCLVLAEMLMLYSVWLIFSGSQAQTKISWDVEAPVTGWSMAWLPLAGLVFAVSAAVLHLLKLGKLATGRLREDELVTVQESEDLASVKAEIDAINQEPTK
jgi:TRAP-type C4-dicarboxylate transport system permease small subunit